MRNFCPIWNELPVHKHPDTEDMVYFNNDSLISEVIKNKLYKIRESQVKEINDCK
jgi:hypothetical protein